MQIAVAQQVVEVSQVAAAPPLAPPDAVAPAELPAPPALVLPLPAAGVVLRSSPPLPPQAEPKTAAPESSTATAKTLDFEEYRMG